MDVLDCVLKNSLHGVLNSEASKQRKLKLSERFYYVQDPDDIMYSNLSKETKGEKKAKNQKGYSIWHHYNFQS